MPTEITPYAALVWVLVGFCTGVGWAVATWVVARVFR